MREYDATQPSRYDSERRGGDHGSERGSGDRRGPGYNTGLRSSGCTWGARHQNIESPQSIESPPPTQYNSLP